MGLCSPTDSVLVSASNGQILHFAASQLRQMGRTAAGVQVGNRGVGPPLLSQEHVTGNCVASQRTVTGGQVLQAGRRAAVPGWLVALCSQPVRQRCACLQRLIQL